MRLEDVANKILVHLKRFEADPEVNKAEIKAGKTRLTPYFWVNTWTAGRYVAVQYVSFQGSTNLTKDQALRYLEWLDKGNVGRHYDVIGVV